MAGTEWAWADLDDGQLALIREAEATLGAQFVIAYRPADRPAVADLGLRPAALDPSQLECLQGVERKVGCVAVAYQAG